MAIIVGDIHGNVEKVQAFLNYRPEVEHIALGDYVDSFYEPQFRQVEAIKMLLDSDTVLLWGNHDLHYLLKPPNICTGFQYHMEKPLQNLIEPHKRRFLAAYAVDGWLCTHAGLAGWLARDIAKDVTDVNLLADMLNERFRKWLDAPYSTMDGFFGIGNARGGDKKSGGIFWFDFKREEGLADVKQIFGHTETKEPVVTESYVALDTTNTKKQCWLFDTSTSELVCLPIERECEYVRLNAGAWM